MKKFLAISLLILGLFGSPSSWAQSAPAPTQVRIGTYVQNLVDLNLRENRVTADFYLWFRWKNNADIAPHDSFEISNGNINSRTVLETRVTGNDRFSQVRVNATLYVIWQLEKFSLDTQTIPIVIEDGVHDTDSLVYVPDASSISVRQTIKIPGYVIGEQRPVVAENTYTTNFGDPDLPQNSPSTYSQYTHNVEIRRPDAAFFFKLFSSVYLAALIAPFGFAMRPENIDSRIGIGVGGIFGVMGSNYTISEQLPPTSAITLADQIYFLSMALVIFCMVLTVINWRINAINERPRLLKTLEGLGLASPVIYVALTVYLAT